MELPFLNNGKMLEGIFTYQLHLMNRYHKMNMIPAWNGLFIDRKDYQAYLRKLISWITDELAEASVEFKAALVETMTPDGLPGGYMHKGSLELMDAMHFIVELMIYSEVDHDDIQDYYAQLTKERNLEIINFSDGLMSTMAYGRHTNTWDDQIRVTTFNTVPIELLTQMGRDKLVIPFRVSEELDALRELCMWDVVKAFSTAARYLKNKEWKVTQTQTNVPEYKRQLMIGWLHFGKLLDLCQLEARTAYYLFEYTNIKNQSRIANGY